MFKPFRELLIMGIGEEHPKKLGIATIRNG
jgi:hypothetical protein